MKAFLVEKSEDKKFTSAVKEIEIPEIGENEVLIKTTYSSLNYKDALSSIGNPGVTRVFPHVTGIDVAGIVYKSNSKDFEFGEEVIVTGYDLGMNTNGGHSEYVKVPSSWIIKKPSNISLKELMIYGTAGLTAALSVNELLANGITKGEVLVTGATGGVGSISVAILAKLGFSVIALSGKEDKIPYLKSLGAKEVILRSTFEELNKKPMLKERFDGLIDTVGGDILANALKQIKYNGVVTCCGLTSSYELNTNVFPFILRGVRLIGIDSVETSIEKKTKAWEKIASDFKINTLDELTSEISLKEIPLAFEKILNSKATGRYLIKF
ncbi:MAG: YhdH/YhfP family quinone oxidoreductase [Campylobacteraceae bacterium]|nr:YhdH/YhfP family quinone oxidoreductase [Campylobacteraceae bacterium]